MEPASFAPSIKTSPAWYVYLWRMILRPLRAGHEIASWQTAWPGLLIVLALGLYMTLGCYRSYLNHDYPPPAEELRVWIETWGRDSMLPLPFLPIPLDQYRLFMALISLPVTIGSWLGMAGIARLLTRWFRKKTTFRQYLNVFAFSFFPFWFLAVIGDGLFTLLTGQYLIPGLQGAHGSAVQAFYKNYPPMLYTVLFGLGAIYNSLGAYSAALEVKRLRWWRPESLVGYLFPCRWRWSRCFTDKDLSSLMR